MKDCIIAILIGIVCIVLGIFNRKGNISSLHRYHRKRVSEEDRIPFGKKVGLGTIICGASLVCYGVLLGISSYTEANALIIIGGIALTVGVLIGLGITLYAMLKYNKGIF